MFLTVHHLALAHRFINDDYSICMVFKEREREREREREKSLLRRSVSLSVPVLAGSVSPLKATLNSCQML